MSRASLSELAANKGAAADKVSKPKNLQAEQPRKQISDLVPEGDVGLTAEIRMDLHLKLKIEAPSWRASEANNIVKKHVIVAMGASLVPVPLFDLVALTGVQLKMLHSLAKRYEVPFSRTLGKSLITSLAGGFMPTTAAMTAASFAKAVPALGTATGMISVSLLGGATTYAIGRVFVEHFESGGTLLDFDTKKMRTYFSTKLEEGKGIAANLEQDRTQDPR